MVLSDVICCTGTGLVGSDHEAHTKAVVTKLSPPLSNYESESENSADSPLLLFTPF